MVAQTQYHPQAHGVEAVALLLLVAAEVVRADQIM
jgi:hypothetical protein